MANYRVLVVEDNHEVRRMVTASIKALDTEIDVLDVPSAEEALFISTSLPLDLVILDIRLPGMSGLEMVARLRKRRPETKVILVTGIEDATLRQQVTQMDVAAYFFKPIEIDAFLDAVKRCLWPERTGELSVITGPSISKAPTGREPPAVSDKTRVTGQPGSTSIPIVSQEPVVSEAPVISTAPAISESKVESEEPVVSETPVISKEPVFGEAAFISKAPVVSEEPVVGEAAFISEEPVVSEAPIIREEPVVRKTPGVGGAPVIRGGPSVSSGREVSGTQPVGPRSFQPTINERLTALKLQLGATSVLLVNETGRVEEVAGNPAQVTAGFAVLPGIVQAISASLQVSEAMGRDTAESLQYFHTMKQCLYLMTVGPKQALLVVISGYFDPDKLGIIDRAMHLAAQDIRTIQESLIVEETIFTPEVEPEQVELPPGIPDDQEALAEIEEMFSTGLKNGEKKEADGFWETFEENGTSDGPNKKDVLSYDQARELGLFPDEDQ